MRNCHAAKPPKASTFIHPSRDRYSFCFAVPQHKKNRHSYLRKSLIRCSPKRYVGLYSLQDPQAEALSCALLVLCEQFAYHKTRQCTARRHLRNADDTEPYGKLGFGVRYGSIRDLIWIAR